jgi:hypothetical protein
LREKKIGYLLDVIDNYRLWFSNSAHVLAEVFLSGLKPVDSWAAHIDVRLHPCINRGLVAEASFSASRRDSIHVDNPPISPKHFLLVSDGGAEIKITKIGHKIIAFPIHGRNEFVWRNGFDKISEGVWFREIWRNWRKRLAIGKNEGVTVCPLNLCNCLSSIFPLMRKERPESVMSMIILARSALA